MTDPSLSNPATPPALADLERRLSLLVVLGGIALWCAALAWLPARFQGYDDAKYIGIGTNVLDGRGPVTVFGGFFEPHSPLWPVILTAPERAVGIDPYWLAHLLGIVSSATLLGLGAWLGWRIRPAVGAMTVAAILAFPYLFELSRRLGLDMPIAALSIGYLIVGAAAIRRGTLGWALGTGALLGAAFLIKESILPLAPVPFLIAIAAGRPGAATARVAAWTALVATILTSWWWWIFAAETGRAYRLGTPAWTLLPLLAGVLVAVVIGLRWDRVVSPIRGWVARRPRLARIRVGPRALGWGLATAWVLLLSWFLGKSEDLRGYGLFDQVQIRTYLDIWFDQLRVLIAVGGIGAALELAARVVGRVRDRRPAVADPTADGAWLALYCSVPVVLVVVGVGEPPRHYVAQIVLLLVVASSGWLALVDATARRPTPARIVTLVVAVGAAVAILAPLIAGRRIALVGLAGMAVIGIVVAVAIAARATTRQAAGRFLRAGGAVVLTLVIVTVAATGSLVARTAGARSESQVDVAKATAVREIDGWIRANVPEGSTVAFGAALAQEAAVPLLGDYHIVQIRETIGNVYDATAPLGIRQPGAEPADDWIAMMANPNSFRAFDGYRASTLIDRLRSTTTDVWVQVESSAEEQPLVVDAALTPDHGFTTGAHWTWPAADGTISATIYEVDRDALAFDDTVWSSAGALERLLGDFEADGSADAKAAATNLAARIRVHPDDPAGPALLARLHRFIEG